MGSNPAASIPGFFPGTSLTVHSGHIVYTFRHINLPESVDETRKALMAMSSGIFFAWRCKGSPAWSWISNTEPSRALLVRSLGLEKPKLP